MYRIILKRWKLMKNNENQRRTMQNSEKIPRSVSNTRECSRYMRYTYKGIGFASKMQEICIIII